MRTQKACKYYIAILMLCSLIFLPRLVQAQNYYVSNSQGNDDNNGKTQTTALQSISKVNSLALEAGDQVLFRCGDTWQGEMLVILHSGQDNKPITFTSFPENCAEKPILSGSLPISEWTPHAANIYVADLSTGLNHGRFSQGINQLFRQGQRLMLGRWPNLDNGDGGYSTIDGELGSNALLDNELPPGDWSGAVAHIKGIRWYLINREVTTSTAGAITLALDYDCWNNCTGWGYFLNNHLKALDQEGEWYFDEQTNKVFLFTSTAPGDDELTGSVILSGEGKTLGGIILGKNLYEHVSHLVIDNLAVQNWFANGITTPINYEADDNQFIVIRNMQIKDVDEAGIKLAVWIWNANNGVDGWRGGHHLTIDNNVIDGANHFGIDSYAYNSTISNNQVKNIGLIENLGKSGMGCGLDSWGGFCTEYGSGIRIKTDNAQYSGHSNIIQYNKVEKVAYHGIGIYGHDNLVEYNQITQACFAKGDCGAIITYGHQDFATSDTHSITIKQNIIIDTIGNTDGAEENFRPLFGMGIYCDEYSRDIAVTGNTVVRSTADGILFQNTTGSITDNILYDNSMDFFYRGQLGLYEAATNVSELRGNVFYGIDPVYKLMMVHGQDTISSAAGNYYFHPFRQKMILVESLSSQRDMDLTAWQIFSGLDADSDSVWFSLSQEDAPRSTLFINSSKEPATFTLPIQSFTDLDKQEVHGNLVVAPFSSQVLISEQGLGVQLPPIVRITANTFSNTVTVDHEDTIRVEVSLEPGTFDGTSADWWVWAESPFGNYIYTVEQGWQLTTSVTPTYGGNLFALAPMTIFEGNLPQGRYRLFFNVDLNKNGVKDQAGYESSVELVVQ